MVRILEEDGEVRVDIIRIPLNISSNSNKVLLVVSLKYLFRSFSNLMVLMRASSDIRDPLGIPGMSSTPHYPSEGRG